MNSNLFVYGSLLSNCGHPMGNRLRQEAILVGPATVAGRLHRVSWYPGLRPAEGPSDLVYGEVYRLSHANVSLAWLDEYEGIKPGGSSVAGSDDYIRVERAITLPNQGILDAWVYFYQRPLPAHTLIPDGFWRG